MLTERLSKFKDKTIGAGRRLDQLSGGRLAIVWLAFRRFGETRAGEAAATLAYYAFFGLFPLLLALIVAGSFVLQREVVQQQLLDALVGVLPGSRQIISNNIRHVLEARGTVGVVALIGLVWSAARAFDALLVNIDRAWVNARPRTFLERRARSLVMIVGIGLVLIVSLMGSLALNLLPQLGELVGQPPPDGASPLAWLALVLPVSVRVVMLWMLYRWAPNTHVKGSAAFWGALIAGLSWELITAGFTLYLRSGLAHYELVYGSVGAVAALLFYIYWISWITLFGAHLSAAVASAHAD
jgi:membrane protein